MNIHHEITEFTTELVRYAIIIAFVVIMVLVGTFISDGEIAQRYYAEHISQFVIQDQAPMQ